VAREQRKLAAILTADVVGYSRLMGRDRGRGGLREHAGVPGAALGHATRPAESGVGRRVDARRSPACEQIGASTCYLEPVLRLGTMTHCLDSFSFPIRSLTGIAEAS